MLLATNIQSSQTIKRQSGNFVIESNCSPHYLKTSASSLLRFVFSPYTCFSSLVILTILLLFARLIFE